MSIRAWWRRLHIELYLLRGAHKRRKQLRYKRALLKRRVVMPCPKPDERSSIETHWRMINRRDT